MSKRKRGKKPAATTEKEVKAPPVSDASIRAARRFVEHDVGPRIFADIARQLGARGARPRDFRCGCVHSFLDGLPICEGKKPGCRYAQRVKEADIDAHASDEAEARYMIYYRAELERRKQTPFRAPA